MDLDSTLLTGRPWQPCREVQIFSASSARQSLGPAWSTIGTRDLCVPFPLREMAALTSHSLSHSPHNDLETPVGVLIPPCLIPQFLYLRQITAPSLTGITLLPTKYPSPFCAIHVIRVAAHLEPLGSPESRVLSLCFLAPYLHALLVKVPILQYPLCVGDITVNIAVFHCASFCHVLPA